MRKPLAVKCVYLSLNVGVLARLFPSARFLLVTRDALATCHSIMAARTRLGRLRSWWSVRPPRYRSLLGRPLWEQTAIQWREVNRLLRSDLEAYAPDRHKEIAYEALCENPRGEMTRIAEWLRPSGYTEYPHRRLPQAFHPPSRPAFEKDVARRISAVIASGPG
jgi:hypothetical protein